MNIPRTDLESFVERSARKVTAHQLHQLYSRLDDLRAKFDGIRAPGYPQFEQQLRFLSRVVEEAALGRERELTFYALSEAAFALAYLTKEVDLIPDFMGDIGLTDDAAIALLVLMRHLEEFAGFARKHDIAWDEVAPTA